MDTSPLLPRTNIPIAVKQLFGKAIGNVTLVFVLLPHCTSIKQWGSGTANKNGASYGGVSATLPIKINNMLLCVGNMSGSAACLMSVRFNAEKNTISGVWDSFQYNTPNPSSWRYLLIGI